MKINLFGFLKGSVVIKGNIIEPIDEPWEVELNPKKTTTPHHCEPPRKWEESEQLTHFTRNEEFICALLSLRTNFLGSEQRQELFNTIKDETKLTILTITSRGPSPALTRS